MENVQKNDALLLFPCPGCKAQLHFNPRQQQMVCEYCGTSVSIDKGTAQVKELDLKAQLMQTGEATAMIEQQVYKCTRCGSETAFVSETPTFVCGFCNFEVVNPVAYKTRIIQPSGIIPFKVDKQQSAAIFKKWLGKGWFAPGDLSQFARADALQGMYLPFWTYDAQTYSEWNGYGGRHYYVTVEDKDANGNTITREEQRTEWIYRSGTYENFFDDILVGGSDEIAPGEYSGILPYNLQELVNFNDSYLSGFKADVYDISVQDGYANAQKIMDRSIYDACTDLCAIDTYRDVEVSTTYSNQTYKHILLPIWVCSYLYKSKRYHFLVNGQTGKIHGRKPVSAAKVVVVIILVLAVILAVYFGTQQ
jgi:DNA-directed RNA polymerase subunit RPC12/RpoP